MSGAVIGFNFHFGMSRAGSPDFLAAEGQKCGFTVDVVPPFEDNGRPVSSGPIRAALAAGRVDVAAEFLGYPWFVSGQVIHGDKRGRELGFPTANLRLDAACGLRHGIYAVRVGSAARRYDGVASFGRRPMFDTGAVLLEVFLFDFAGDLYGRTIDVAFIGWIREEEEVRLGRRTGAADAGRQRARRASVLARGRRISADLGVMPSARWRCARCSRAHCAATMPSSATGNRRCQPSLRPIWTAVPRIFGSSSHDGACARAARSRIARSRCAPPRQQRRHRARPRRSATK